MTDREPLLVLVCGSRTWSRDDIIAEQLARLPRGSTIIHGGARGADRIAAAIARKLGLPVEEYPAKWHGRKGVYNPHAGLERNLVMLDRGPDLVLAFHRDNSTGTQHVISEATRRGIRLVVISA